ncbi:MAG: maltooligosyltrehalose trehalohydrolase [Gaiellaceae bacterium]|nr:maltooligosyltrehalose trehalohydrolase [Gaiellaceae bacterium]
MSVEGLSRRLGAVPAGDREVELRVWAPGVRSLAVDLAGGRHELGDGGDGLWEARIPAAAGDEYRLVVDGAEAYPDPCSRAQPHGVRGPSAVVDTRTFRWTDDAWEGVALDDLVVYELHVGTFSEEGTFDGVVPRLRALRELGVTAIELMPVASFPGERGWGYDGLYTFAPHRSYGGPEGLARLVDAAHAEGVGVLLDVVYNHVGPGNEALRAFGPYFTSEHETFWGDAIDYAQAGVREWAIQNAEQWVRDYHVDGLRLDAVHAIVDDSPQHICAELAARVRAANPRALVISEMEVDDWRPIDEWGHDAQWADRVHHELHVLLTGERDGYYAGYGSLPGLADALRGEGHDPRRLVIFAQNHDQVGNRAVGDRLPPDALRVAAAVTLFSTCTPLLFMGEETLEPHPFQFFTDHIDPDIADATREGRKQEFAAFASFSGQDVPDPQAVDTFLRSKLSDREPDPLYRELLALRRALPRELDVEVDEAASVLRLRRGAVELVADFRAKQVDIRNR